MCVCLHTRTHTQIHIYNTMLFSLKSKENPAICNMNEPRKFYAQ